MTPTDGGLPHDAALPFASKEAIADLQQKELVALDEELRTFKQEISTRLKNDVRTPRLGACCMLRESQRQVGQLDELIQILENAQLNNFF